MGIDTPYLYMVDGTLLDVVVVCKAEGYDAYILGQLAVGCRGEGQCRYFLLNIDKELIAEFRSYKAVTFNIYAWHVELNNLSP